MSDFILNFTPTGMVPTKESNFNTPIAVNEIVDDVLLAAEYGASIAHLHARDEITGEPTVSENVYEKIIYGIRKYNKKIILCVSLSGRNISDPNKRVIPLMLDGEVKPDMGSLTLSSLNFINQASMNAPDTICFLAKKMQDKAISPEVEVFDLGMANYVNIIKNKGFLPPKPYLNIILGNVSGAQNTFSNIAAILNNIPNDIICSFGGIGRYQTKSTILGLLNGYGVRIGLEDNIWYDLNRKVLASNKSLLKRIVSFAQELELIPASTISVRERLGLEKGDGEYGLKCN
ncbi:beta-keto acid cleavage family enzyme [Lonsdalea quercina]|uniref:3-keto-5-aminohexanoate cleavage protein n=1 Tax=Lonsdalea quercina TaxID=71657 RepID=UPI0039767D58